MNFELDVSEVRCQRISKSLKNKTTTIEFFVKWYVKIWDGVSTKMLVSSCYSFTFFFASALFSNHKNISIHYNRFDCHFAIPSTAYFLRLAWNNHTYIAIFPNIVAQTFNKRTIVYSPTSLDLELNCPHFETTRLRPTCREIVVMKWKHEMRLAKAYLLQP